MQEGCDVVAHERLTEQRVAIKWLLAKRKSISDLSAFLSFLWHLPTEIDNRRVKKLVTLKKILGNSFRVRYV